MRAMSNHVLSCSHHVDRAFESVRDTLLANPYYVFRHATAAAATHGARLHVSLGTLDVGANVEVQVTTVDRDYAHVHPAARLVLAWQAATNPRLFPTMTATLLVVESAPGTKLDLHGSYVLPMGKVGDAIAAAGGQRLIEASVAQFLHEVAGWLEEELAEAPRARAMQHPASC